VVPHLSQFEDADPAAPDATADAAWQARLRAAGARDDAFVFYAVGFWSNRKAMDRVLEAYVQAFDARDPVAWCSRPAATTSRAGSAIGAMVSACATLRRPTRWRAACAGWPTRRPAWWWPTKA
jgi:hypothetical protein